MFHYINKITGATIDSPCVITGKDWVRSDEEKIVVTDVVSTDIEEMKVDPEAEVEGQVVKLSDLTVAELREIAEEWAIDLGPAKKKDDIISVLLAAQDAFDDQE